jgi:hypothetical protein
VLSVCLPKLGGLIALNNQSDVKFAGTPRIVGDSFIYNGSIMTITGSTEYVGTVHFDASSTLVLKGGGRADRLSMTDTELKLREDIFVLAKSMETLNPTQRTDLTDLSISTQFVADPALKMNVVSLRNLDLASGSSLTISGTSSSVFVLKISGTAAFGDGIILDGVLPSHVLIFFSDTNSTAAVSIGSTVGGTFMSLTRSVRFSGQGTFKGAIISGSCDSPAISVGGNGGGTATADFTADGFCAKSQ